jgi:hypothetical protein
MNTGIIVKSTVMVSEKLLFAIELSLCFVLLVVIKVTILKNTVWPTL